MNGSVALSQAKKYTDKSLQGLGSIKGSPCTIKSVTEVNNGTEIIFEWESQKGISETSTIFVENGADGTDGNGISNVEKINTVGLIDTYRITFTDGNTFDYSITNGTKGEQGVQGLKGDKGEQGEQGVQGVQGIKGEKGDDGYPFLIYKEYSDISEFNKNDFPEIGLMFIIKSDGAVSFPVYRYTGNTSTPYSFVTELTGGEGIKGDKGDKGEQGEQGIQGENGKDGITYTPVIGTVVAGDTASVSVVVDENTSTATFNFVLPKGDKGDNGANGVNGSDGITPHIDSVTKHWFIGETDTGILAEGVNGNDGATPYIGSNGNWFIENADTGVKAQGKDGKSIKSITKDDNNNIIVTFSDNTTQNIGKLTVDVQADFLTDGGFGNLRYYNGHFQYYNTTSSAWVDTSVTPDNVYVMNMTPQPMKSISCKYNKNTGKLYLKFTEPDDTIVDGQAFCVVEKVIIRRKLGSVPTDENDGDLVIEVLRHDFGTYSKKWFTDKGITPNIGDTYYYKAFPMSTTGFYNYSDLNVASVTCKEYVLYGFMINQNESDPANMITYLSDCDNADYNSAFMDFDNNVFNYGDWENSWFITDLMPCMLKYDGTVDYELDKDNYSKKINGSDSDIANTAYEGNAMVGIPKVYWKIIDNGDNTAKVYICNSRLDDDFHCWSHIDNNGNEIDYCYMPIYNGSNIDNILRSLSNQTPIKAVSCENEINYALNNNKDSNIIWYIETFSDRMLINILLMLIGKSTDSQAIFGSGNCTLKEVINSGTMDSKGLFWGNNDGTSGVKIFGIENWWGNQWRRIAGWINNNGTQKIKMTYGQSDGTIVDGYTLNGDGYISLNTITIPTSSGDYIDKLSFTNYGILPISRHGSSTTYYTDSLWCFNNNIYFACVGGDNYEKTYQNGMFATLLQIPVTQTENNIASSISCKPLAPTT